MTTAHATDKRNGTRERLLDGAAEAAVARGVRDAAVDDILKASSLSRRTFYIYFRSKDDAFLALYESVVEDLLGDVKEAVEGVEDPTRKLFVGLEAYLDFQFRGDDLITLLQAEAANPASLLSPARERTLGAMVELVDDEVRATLGQALDKDVYRCLFLGLECLVIRSRDGGPLTREDRDRLATIIKHLFVQVMVASETMPHREI